MIEVIIIIEKNNIKYIKILNNDDIKDWFTFNLKALSFNEINNFNEITNFINKCQKLNDKNYNNDLIKDISFKKKYLTYIYYKDDNPLGFLITYINNEDDINILHIEDIGIINKFKNKNYELDFIKNILIKAWEKRRVDKAEISFRSESNPLIKTIKELNFTKNS